MATPEAIETSPDRSIIVALFLLHGFLRTKPPLWPRILANKRHPRRSGLGMRPQRSPSTARCQPRGATPSAEEGNGCRFAAHDLACAAIPHPHGGEFIMQVQN